MNIIVSHTPICTTLDVLPAYEPLTKYGVNVFAFDFSGTGNSGGEEKDFSICSVVNDFDKVVDYIEEHYSSNIHLHGDTGIGGMFAQCYVCSTDRIESFAQFASRLSAKFSHNRKAAQIQWIQLRAGQWIL